MKSKLGLPLEYSELSEYFDALSEGNHKPTHEAIERFLRENQVETVLDLTCGTGSQVF